MEYEYARRNMPVALGIDFVVDGDIRDKAAALSISHQSNNSALPLCVERLWKTVAWAAQGHEHTVDSAK